MRRTLLLAHRWLGLVAGVLLVVLGLSGSVLVYRGDLERWQARAWLEVVPAGDSQPLDALVAAANAGFPERTLSRVVPANAPGRSVEVVLQKVGARTLKEAQLVSVYVDPYRAEVLGVRDRTRGFLPWLQDLHYALFLEEPGLRANGAFALALLLLAVSGPFLWWPGRARWKSALRVRRRPAVAATRDLHAVGGVVLCVVLGIVALTGLYYAWRTPATAVIGALTGDPPLRPPVVAATTAVAPASLELLLAAARLALPEALLDELRPGRGTRPASVTFRDAAHEPVGRHRAWLDPVDARVLRIDRHAALPAGPRLHASMGPWHFGSFGGRTTQFVWFLAGLAPAALFGTGLWLWLRARRRRAVV